MDVYDEMQRVHAAGSDRPHTFFSSTTFNFPLLCVRGALHT